MRLLIPALRVMKDHFSPDAQAKLARLAAQRGRESDALVMEAIELMVHQDEWFMAEVQTGLRQIERGQTVSHENVGTRLDATLSSRQQPAS